MSNNQDLKSLILPDLLDVRDLAQRMHRSEEGIRKMLRSGELPGKKVGGKWVIVRILLLRALDPRTPPPDFIPNQLRIADAPAD